jgi:hypothetical protein
LPNCWTSFSGLSLLGTAMKTVRFSGSRPGIARAVGVSAVISLGRPRRRGYCSDEPKAKRGGALNSRPKMYRYNRRPSKTWSSSDYHIISPPSPVPSSSLECGGFFPNWG